MNLAPHARLALAAALAVTVPAAQAAPAPAFEWAGPTSLRSLPRGLVVGMPDDEPEGWRPTGGVAVKITSSTKGRATVTDAFGAREVAVPGSFEARGPVRIVVRFAPDDFFETVLVLPEEGDGAPVEVKVPAEKSRALIAGARKIPVSRGVKIVTYRDDPKRLDLSRMDSRDGMPMYGDRYVGLGQRGVDIRQVLFHVSLTPTVAETVKELVDSSLSTHLLVDRDGTVYQLLDLDAAAYHAGDANQHSIGVDFVQPLERFPFKDDMTFERWSKLAPPARAAWQGAAERWQPSTCACGELPVIGGPLAADFEGEQIDPKNPLDLPHDLNLGVKDPRRIHPLVGPVEIHGQQFRAFGPTPAATESALLVTSALLDAYPSIPATLPANHEGALIGRVADDPRRYGVVGHYHWEAQRWDPGPGFDWQAFADLMITRLAGAPSR